MTLYESYLRGAEAMEEKVNGADRAFSDLGGAKTQN